MSNCRNCIYFEEVSGEEWPENLPYHCKRNRTLFSQEDLDNGRMGVYCRLWDAFIPKDSTPEQIKYAQRWQDMGYNDQPDYYEYFKGISD